MPSGCWPLPGFLLGSQNFPDLAATRAGLTLTGHFLAGTGAASRMAATCRRRRLRLDALRIHQIAWRRESE